MTSRSGPSVGVLIAAYEAETTIGKAVASALGEPEVSEVWVVDDCSRDATVAEAQAADDGTGRLRVIRQSANQGPAAARNRALAESKADWVCVLDADDFFLPGRISRLLARSEGYDLVADELIRVDAGQPMPFAGDFDNTPAGRSIDLASFVEGNVGRKGETRRELGFIKPLMRRALLKAWGLFYDPNLRLGEDYVFYAMALASGARLILSPPLGYVAVVRTDSLSGKHSIADLQALRDSEGRIKTLRTLTVREEQAFRSHYLSLDKRLQWRRLIEAVKTRDLTMAASTLTSAPVGLHLLGELGNQALSRSGVRRPV